MFAVLTPAQRVARAVSDLRMGLPVSVASLPGTYVLAVESLHEDQWNMIRSMAATISVAVTKRRAHTLKMAAYDGDLARITIDPNEITFNRLRALADPSQDLTHPMKGPFDTLRGGDASAHRAGIALCKMGRLLPAALVVTYEDDAAPRVAAQKWLWINPAEVEKEATASMIMSEAASANVPTTTSEQGRVHVFRGDNGADEHYAIEIGDPSRSKPVLARLHSACFTGDVLGSLKCDCGPQLQAALAQMGEEGAGVLLYLNQEGRGIGLTNKMRAYSLQDQGFDTVDANHRLGFEDDERDFRIGARILQDMGFSQVRLLTNNPNKVARLESCGLDVTERVPLIVGQTAQNAHYLATKANKSGHLF